MNQTAERLISPAAQASPCVLLVSETKTSAEGMKEDAGSKKEEGKGEECHQHFGCGGKERSSETSEEITTTKSLAVLTYQTVLRVRPAWHDF